MSNVPVELERIQSQFEHFLAAILKMRQVSGVRIFLVFSGFLSCHYSIGGEAYAAEQDIRHFLQLARKPPVLDSWAKLNGTVRHKGNGKSIKNIPIEIRAHLTPDTIMAQIIFNQQAHYLSKQRFSGGDDGSEVILQREAEEGYVSISDVGLRPDDITLSFLFWNFEREYPQGRVRGQNCRVVKLKSPKGNDSVKVWLSMKYYFPLKVEWSRSDDRFIYRTLEFTGFEKIKDAWIIKELKIRGGEWKTIIKLKDNIVESITLENPMPDDLFIPE